VAATSNRPAVAVAAPAVDEAVAHQASPFRRAAKAQGVGPQAKADRAAKKAKPKKQKKGVTGRARGHGKTRYAGDASVAARHVKVRPARATGQAARPSRSQRPVRSKRQHLPGPFDSKPPKKRK
jgi:hypothetical protein